MKRFLCAIMMLALVMTMVLAPCAPAMAASTYTVKATSSVNLRKGPGLGYDKITSVSKGKTLTYSGVSRFDSRGVAWHKVSYNGSSAWISWKYSNLQKNGSSISESKAVRASAALNVRKGAGTSYGKLTTVSKGANMVYLGETAKVGGTTWYKVSCSAGMGWVSGAYSKLVSVPEVTAQSSSSGKIVATASVYLRKGPGLGYGKITSISEGASLTYLNESEKDDRGVTWYKVSYKNGSAWVSSRYSKKA